MGGGPLYHHEGLLKQISGSRPEQARVGPKHLPFSPTPTGWGVLLLCAQGSHSEDLQMNSRLLSGFGCPG